MFKQENLQIKLKSIGRSFFVKYFEDFMYNDYETFMEKENYTEKSMRNRASTAKSIFTNRQEFEALKNIVNSTRIEEYVKQKAQKLLKKYNQI
ncbi:hypothetical protein [Campylobacter curvus]|uniref:hypothetical protein n=1 Tax=Campylobacter curvus TaxID=200 RepID=UPI001470422C|nr:hypothetical protein [Campylobacter curvus]